MKKYNIDSGIKFKVGDNKDIVFLFFSLVVSGLFLYFIVGASYRESLIVVKETELKQANLETKKSLLNDIEDFNEESKDSDMDVNKLSSFISNRSNYEDFFAHINGLAARENVEISEIVLEDVKKAVSDKEKDNGGFNEKAVSFSLSGDYSHFLGFMESMENSAPFVQEIAMSIKAQESNDKTSEKEDEEGEEEVREANLYPTLEYSVSFKFLYY
ncbi:MAG: hypothetical protein PHI66_01900 [Candidatus Pacebacteria bacterium]|nr:hypothetical protein [Candidatus Paceibacterota bacterium]